MLNMIGYREILNVLLSCYCVLLFKYHNLYLHLQLINRFFNYLILKVIGKLINVTVYAKDTTQYTSASPQCVQADAIQFAGNASLAQKQSVPSASGSINSFVKLNYADENSGQNHVWLINEAYTTLTTNS